MLENGSLVSTKGCVEMTVWITKQLTSVWTQLLRCPKLESISIAHTPLCCLLFLAAITQKKYWLAFLVAEAQKIASKLSKKAVLELKAMICQSQVLKILIDPGGLPHTTSSSLLEPFWSEEGVRESEKIWSHITWNWFHTLVFLKLRKMSLICIEILIGTPISSIQYSSNM